MKNSNRQVWFITGSQDLYGLDVLKTVAEHSEEIVSGLNASGIISSQFINKGTVKSSSEIVSVCQAANNDENCLGVALWMHTFSPAKMWIAGLKKLNKPFVHLHTQFNAQLPWAEIDMNFMNTNQSAHGCREFGFIGTRMQLDRKVIVGHWQDEDVHKQLDNWSRAALGWSELQQLKVARFGDNMRHVAVTEGNKVSAQIQFGFEVHGYSLGELADVVNSVGDDETARMVDEYCSCFHVSKELLENEYKKILENEARLEIGMERFLESKGCMAFTNCFENLTGLTNLPGLATQRLMAKGYGYGGEGDWKTAAMTRVVKVMAEGLPGGTSFMEDYTYNFADVDQVLGAHMLEVCPTIAAAKPKLEIHRHTIGCDCDVARLIFDGQAGDAINLSLIDLGERYRLLVNTVKSVQSEQAMKNLPVARTLWEPMPNLKTAAAAWIYAGGAHHTTYTQAINMEIITDLAEMMGVELVTIDQDTNIPNFKQLLRNNEVYYKFLR